MNTVYLKEFVDAVHSLSASIAWIFGWVFILLLISGAF